MLRIAVLLTSVLMLTACQTMNSFQESLQDTLASISGPESEAEEELDLSAVDTADVYYRLGLRYSNGVGGEKDDEAAAKAFRTAAEQGHAEAQLMLGLAYLSGQGVKQNSATAVRWLARSADQGVAEAQLKLGTLYLNGQGVDVEEAWGMQWIGRAADQGLAEAQYQFGVGWATGLGLPKDLAEGAYWIELAAKQGHGEAKKLGEAVVPRLSDSQRVRLQQQLSAYQPRQEGGLARGLVRFVQFALNQQRFDAGAVDGWMGPTTAAAIKGYEVEVLNQKATGVISDGLVQSLRLKMKGDISRF